MSDREDDRFIEHQRRGDAALARGDWEAARTAYADALGIAQKLARQDPQNADRQNVLLTSHHILGDVMMAIGEMDVARVNFERGLALAQKWADQDPDNTRWQLGLSDSYNRLGAIAQATGDLEIAREAYVKELAIVEKLVARYPSDNLWLSRLSTSHGQLGDVARASGDLRAAEEAYATGLTILRRLAKQSPGNGQWQRDLFIGHIKLGEVAQASDHLDMARSAYEEVFAIARRRAAEDPGNISWQRHLSASYQRRGDVAQASGDLTKAQEAHAASRAIAKKLAGKSKIDADVDWNPDIFKSADDTPAPPPPTNATRKRTKGKLAPPPPPAPTLPPPAEAVQSQRDIPARQDLLGRAHFAQVIASKIRDAQDRGVDGSDDRAFMVQLHGPWGSGKTSVLNLIETELTSKIEDKETQWAVIKFDAWKHARLRPPWWSLITTIYKSAIKNPRIRQNVTLRWTWWKWRLRADFLPMILVATLLGLVGYGLLHYPKASDSETYLKVFAGVAAAGAGLFGYARFLSFGSAKAAQTYAEQRADPFGPMIALLNNLVAAIKRPVIVFVDDLDRCDGDYVVELLEGIQTLQRSAPIVWIVAADRKWLRSSFEKKYGDFTTLIGDPARPLGYLFLDKMFQMSVALPRLTTPARKKFWKHLLLPDLDSPENLAAVEAAQAEAKEELKNVTSHEGLAAAILAKHDASFIEQQAIRVQAALQITTPEAVRATEHRLMKFDAIIEPNPRAMKRLANAVNTAQACSFIGDNAIDPDLLARWTMIEIRWPLLAEAMVADPALLKSFQQIAAKPATRKKAAEASAWVAAHGNDAELLAIIGAGEGYEPLGSGPIKLLA